MVVRDRKSYTTAHSSKPLRTLKFSVKQSGGGSGSGGSGGSGGSSESANVVTDKKGKITKASLTEKTAKGKKIQVDLKTDKKGNVVVSIIDATSSSVEIPDKLVDSNGKSHKVKSINAKALNCEKKVEKQLKKAGAPDAKVKVKK